MLTIFTIVLNGQPYIARQLSIFQRLSIPWRWSVVEGVSQPVGCTNWCAEVQSRWHRDGLSVDGTTEHLDGITDPRVRVQRRSGAWQGKLAMVNAALDGLSSDVTLQIDADEFWTHHQIEAIYGLLIAKPIGTGAQFDCRVYVGPRKVVTTRLGFGSMPYEWIRAWRFGPGVRFISHEPPALNVSAECVSREDTHRMGLIFHHFAYATREQVEFKEEFYRQPGLVAGWDRLQQTAGTVRLGNFFPFLRGQPWAKAGDVTPRALV